MAAYHGEQAELARAQRLSFEKGEVLTLGVGFVSPTDPWALEVAGILHKTEQDHLAAQACIVEKIGNSQTP